MTPDKGGVPTLGLDELVPQAEELFPSEGRVEREIDRQIGPAVLQMPPEVDQADVIFMGFQPCPTGRRLGQTQDIL